MHATHGFFGRFSRIEKLRSLNLETEDFSSFYYYYMYTQCRWIILSLIYEKRNSGFEKDFIIVLSICRDF